MLAEEGRWSCVFLRGRDGGRVRRVRRVMESCADDGFREGGGRVIVSEGCSKSAHGGMADARAWSRSLVHSCCTVHIYLT
jgi:hypothetical protein